MPKLVVLLMSVARTTCQEGWGDWLSKMALALGFLTNTPGNFNICCPGGKMSAIAGLVCELPGLQASRNGFA